MQGEEALIIAGNNEAHLYKAGGNTTDIISAIREADTVSISYVEEFAHTLEGADIAETCANVWHWVRNTIPYKEDGSGIQKVQLPGQLYNNRYSHLGGTNEGGDCKSMSLLCSSILRSLGNYNFSYRFITENRSENFHHVYLVVEHTDEETGAPCYIPLDCTLSDFAVEVNYAKKKDVQPTAPAKTAIAARIGGMQDDIDNWTYGSPYPVGWAARVLTGLLPDYTYLLTDLRHWAIYSAPDVVLPPTQEEVITNWTYGSPFPIGWTARASLGLQPDYTYLLTDIRHWAVYNDPNASAVLYGKGISTYWELETNDLKKNYVALVAALNLAVKGLFINKYAKHGMPIQFSESMNQLNKHFDELLAMGSTLIYRFWNDTTFLSYGACRGQGATSFPPVAFPERFNTKRDASNTFYDGLIKWGWTYDALKQLCNLGIYAKYGVGLDYMLYRCKCIELYGQPFAPHPGVPYWNNTTGAFIPNAVQGGDHQAQLLMSLQILSCFPAHGGVGRPFGEPYWSTGGWVINNGAGDAAAKAWQETHAKPGTVYGDGTTEPGILFNNGAGVTWEKQLQYLEVYNKWCKGNLVMLPQPIYNPDVALLSGASIGYAVGEIVTIVVAVVSACIAIAGFIAKMIAQFTHSPDSSNIALPTTDFKWDYQTADGCLIGHCVNVAGCQGATTAKMCNGEIVELNPDPNNPSNQPPDPGNFFTGPGSKKKLLIGGGVLLLGGGMVAAMD